jgi:hypothetical protein
MTAQFRHRKVFDLSPLEQEQRDTLQVALNETELPLGELRQAVGDRVAVVSSDLKRLEFAMKDRTEVEIVEFHDREPRRGVVRADGDPASVSWMPSRYSPAGTIELAERLFEEDAAVQAEFIALAEELIERHILPVGPPRVVE